MAVLVVVAVVIAAVVLEDKQEEEEPCALIHLYGISADRNKKSDMQWR